MPSFMQSTILAALVASTAQLASAAAIKPRSCQLSGAQPTTATHESRTALCQSQGEGAWTFALYDSLTGTGLPASDNGDPSSEYSNIIANSYWAIYDNACMVKAVYEPCTGYPQVIEENFLADVLTITDGSVGQGSSSFTFDYGNGVYSTGNNHCACTDMSYGTTGAKGCGCSFPVNGVSD